jgi:Spy/CpxP family protein refolding chaperone
MNTLSALLMITVFALTPWGLADTARAAEPSTAEPQPPATDGEHGGKIRRFFERLKDEGPHKRESYGDVVLRHADALKLSDEQVGKIARIHQNNQEKIGEIGKKLRATRKSAYHLFLNPASDEAAIRKAAKEHTAAFDELVETALKSRAAINAALTPEQLNQLKSFQ